MRGRGFFCSLLSPPFSHLDGLRAQVHDGPLAKAGINLVDDGGDGAGLCVGMRERVRKRAPNFGHLNTLSDLGTGQERAPPPPPRPVPLLPTPISVASPSPEGLTPARTLSSSTPPPASAAATLGRAARANARTAQREKADTGWWGGGGMAETARVAAPTNVRETWRNMGRVVGMYQAGRRGKEARKRESRVG